LNSFEAYDTEETMATTAAWQQQQGVGLGGGNFPFLYPLVTCHSDNLKPSRNISII